MGQEMPNGFSEIEINFDDKGRIDSAAPTFWKELEKASEEYYSKLLNKEHAFQDLIAQTNRLEKIEYDFLKKKNDLENSHVIIAKKISDIEGKKDKSKEEKARLKSLELELKVLEKKAAQLKDIKKIDDDTKK